MCITRELLPEVTFSSEKPICMESKHVYAYTKHLLFLIFLWIALPSFEAQTPTLFLRSGEYRSLKGLAASWISEFCRGPAWNQTCFSLGSLSHVNLIVRPKNLGGNRGQLNPSYTSNSTFFFSFYPIQILLLHASPLPRMLSETVLSHRDAWPFHLPAEHRLPWGNGLCLELLFHNQTEKHNLVFTQQICALILRKRINDLKND